MYSTDLAYIHDAGFGDFAERAAPEAIRILRHAGFAFRMSRSYGRHRLMPGGVAVIAEKESHG